MSTVFIVVVSVILAGCSAICTGGKLDPANSRGIFIATRQITRVGNERVICSYNLCKHLDITINRVDIKGNFTCKSGGPGDFKVEIYVGGGDTRSFWAQIFATGKDRDTVLDPTNPYTWGCKVESVYSNRC